MSKPLKVFITYARENRTVKNKLITCLKGMQREDLISIWHDNEIIAGDKWREEIFTTNLPDSDLLLYLVSASSLDSENCNKELGIALEENIRPILIILEDCDWKNYKLSNVQAVSTEGFRLNEWESLNLGDIQALPAEGKPLNEWDPRSKGWQSVVEGFRKAIQTMLSQAELALQQGIFLMTLRQIDRAIEVYSRAIKLNPNYADAYYGRGYAYESKDNFDRAIENYTKAIDLKSDFDIFYINRGVAYGKKGDYDRAVEDFTKAIQLKPDDAEAYYNRGTVYGMKSNHNLAIKDFTKAIKLKPDYAIAYDNRGNAYLHKSDYDRAIIDFTKAIDLKPDHANAYYNRGVAHNNKGDSEGAIADFAKVIDLNPNFAIAYYNRGVAYERKGDVESAIADFTKAMEMNPNLIETYYNRGVTYSDKGDYDRAIAACTTIIEMNPNFAIAYINRGSAYGKKDDYDRAIKDFTKAIEFKPDFAVAYTNRGIAYERKGDVESAIADHTKAIDLKNDYANAYYNRGVAYGIKGEYDRAIEDYTKAINLNPNDVKAYNNRGVARYKKSDYELAIEDYTEAIDLKPDFAEACYNRGEAWLHVQAWEDAKADLIVAKDKGINIITAFHNDYRSVEDFERRNRVKLPEDIAAMLTQRRRSRFPRTEKFLRPDGTPLESLDVLNLLAKLRNAGTHLSQYIQTRPTFGLKIGRSEAFVVDSETRDQLIAEHPASADILKPFLHGRDIRRWQVARPVDKSRSIGDAWLIFTYRRIEIDRYPAIRKHLEKYRSSLRKRAGKQKWYELPTTRSNAEHFTQTKLICPNSYDHQTFAVDTEGFYCGDTCYLIPTEEAWLCGLLNSRAVEWFYSQVSKQLTGDYLRARSRYIQEIPIPDLTSTQKALIGKIVDYLIFLQGQPTTSGRDLAHARDFIMLGYFERIIDGLVYESYLGEELHQGEKQFFKPLFDERLSHLEEIQGDKMAALREIFERLYERTHPVRKNLFFLDSVKSIRIIEGKA